MALPLILYLSTASQALPLGAGLTVRGRLSQAPVRWVLVWCALLLASDALFLLVAFIRGENLWLHFITIPASSVAALWALSGWQPNDFLRLSYRLTVVVLLLVTLALVLAVQPQALFDQVLAPLHHLVVLSAALHTLVHRTLVAETPITQEEWFWIALGMSLYFAASTAVRPFAQALVVTHPEWVRWAYYVRAAIQIFAFALIAWGVFWPSYRRSGGPS